MDHALTTTAKLREPCLQGRRIRHHQLSRGTRRRRPQVGDKIRDGEINLMPDRRNDRQRTRGNRARYNFFIEIPQVLDGPAATPDDQHLAAR